MKQFSKNYLCDQCDYATTKPVYLKLHKESKHEDIRHYIKVEPGINGEETEGNPLIKLLKVLPKILSHEI